MSFSKKLREWWRLLHVEVDEEDLQEGVSAGHVRDMGIVDGCQMYVLVNRRWRKKYFGQSNVVAFQLDGFILFRDFNQYRDVGIRAHEVHHVRQQERYGPFWFSVLYGLGFIGGYYLNPMEITANLAGRRARKETIR